MGKFREAGSSLRTTDVSDFDNRPSTGILPKSEFAATATSRAFRCLDPAREIAQDAGDINESAI